MMKYPFFVAAIVLLLTMNSCNNDNAQSSYSYAADDGKEGRKTLTMKNDSVSLRVEYSGEIKLNETETAIRHIAENGFLHYSYNNDRIEALPDSNGVAYTLSRGGASLSPTDEGGKAFLAQAIREMIAYGFEADERIARLYAQGGHAAVLNGLKDIQVDYVKVRYLEKVMAAHPSQETVTAVLEKTGYLTSDFEKGKLLRRFRPDSLQPASFNAYMTAVQGIQMSFEKNNILRYITEQPLTDSQFSRVLDVWQTLDGEFEKTELLKHIAAKGLSSDAEWVALIHAATKISGGFDKTNVLVTIAEKMPLKEMVIAAYRQAAATIADKGEQERALKAISR